MIDFALVGLPRSGTTWFANWLTTDRSLCLHDPFAQGLPDSWPKDDRRRGISCTLAYLIPGWLERVGCPVAVIERDPSECQESAEKLQFPTEVHAPNDACMTLRKSLDLTDGRRWQYTDIWNEEKARDLWAFLLPEIPFDAIRYRELRRMQVQPYMPGWSMKQGVLETMMG